MGAVKLPRLTEAAFQRQVIHLAHLCGFKVAHFRAAKTVRSDGSVRFLTPVQADGKGFPDLVLVRARGARTIFAELKTDAGRVGPEQQQWFDVLMLAGQEVYVWRPKNFDAIQRILGR